MQEYKQLEDTSANSLQYSDGWNEPFPGEWDPCPISHSRSLAGTVGMRRLCKRPIKLKKPYWTSYTKFVGGDSTDLTAILSRRRLGPSPAFETRNLKPEISRGLPPLPPRIDAKSNHLHRHSPGQIERNVL